MHASVISEVPTSLIAGANLTFILDLLGSLLLPLVNESRDMQIIRKKKASENDWGLAQLLSEKC